jgi:hypothetical protein
VQAKSGRFRGENRAGPQAELENGSIVGARIAELATVTEPGATPSVINNSLPPRVPSFSGCEAEGFEIRLAPP